MSFAGHRRPADEGPIDVAQADALNRYLDRLDRGDAVPLQGDDLDPALAATARAVRGPDPGAAPGRADEDRLWRELSQSGKRPPIVVLPPTRRPLATLPTSNAPGGDGPLPRRGVGDQSAGRLRTVGGRTLGVVATLSLVLLIAMSAFLLYLNAPPSDVPPTSFAAALASTPAAAPVAVGATPGAVSDSGPVPADALRPIVQDCTVTPRTIDDVITTLALPYTEPAGRDLSTLPVNVYADRPYLLPNTVTAQGEPRGPIVEPLPAGGPVDPGTVDALARLYGQWVGCGLLVRDDALAQASLYSDDGLIRYFWRDGLGPEGFMLVGLGREPGHPDTGNPALAEGVTPPPGSQLGIAPEYIPVIGQPWHRWLWGFRTLGDGRVAAYIADGGPAWDDYPLTFAEMSGGQLANGYLVFVQQDGQWLIDELRGPFQG